MESMCKRRQSQEPLCLGWREHLRSNRIDKWRFITTYNKTYQDNCRLLVQILIQKTQGWVVEKTTAKTLALTYKSLHITTLTKC